MATHPACGLYKTGRALEGVAAGRLVYFHNHGDPGAGIYLPERWASNRAQWSARGITVSEDWSSTLVPVLPEGLYRVRESFVCCEKKCRTYAAGLMVQLGYNGNAEAILFVPEWTDAGLRFPGEGLKPDVDRLRALEKLDVPVAAHSPNTSAPGGLLH